MASSILDIIPRSRLLQRSLRLAMLIVAMMLIGTNVFILKECKIDWILLTDIFCLIILAMYVMLVIKMTSISTTLCCDKQYRTMGYILILVASIPAMLLFLCGADFQLYDILGVYIITETDKLIFPLAIAAFVSITYWLPIMELNKVFIKINAFKDIKNKYGK